MTLRKWLLRKKLKFLLGLRQGFIQTVNWNVGQGQDHLARARKTIDEIRELEREIDKLAEYLR